MNNNRAIVFRSQAFWMPKSMIWVACNPDSKVYAYKNEPVWSDKNECWDVIGEQIGILSNKPIGIGVARGSKLNVISSNSNIEWLQLAAIISYLHQHGRMDEARKFMISNSIASWFPKDADAFIQHSGVASATDTCILIHDVISKASAKQVEYGNRTIAVPYNTQYLAMEQNGVLYAFAEKPYLNYDEWRGKGKVAVSWLAINDDDFTSVEDSLLKV